MSFEESPGFSRGRGFKSGTVTYNTPTRGKNKIVDIIISIEKAEKIITDDEMFEIFRPIAVQKKLTE